MFTPAVVASNTLLSALTQQGGRFNADDLQEERDALDARFESPTFWNRPDRSALARRNLVDQQWSALTGARDLLAEARGMQGESLDCAEVLLAEAYIRLDTLASMIGPHDSQGAVVFLKGARAEVCEAVATLSLLARDWSLRVQEWSHLEQEDSLELAIALLGAPAYGVLRTHGGFTVAPMLDTPVIQQDELEVHVVLAPTHDHRGPRARYTVQHWSTGVVVTMEEVMRSSAIGKNHALAMLRAKLYLRAQAQARAEAAED